MGRDCRADCRLPASWLETRDLGGSLKHHRYSTPLSVFRKNGESATRREARDNYAARGVGGFQRQRPNGDQHQREECVCAREIGSHLVVEARQLSTVDVSERTRGSGWTTTGEPEPICCATSSCRVHAMDSPSTALPQNRFELEVRCPSFLFALNPKLPDPAQTCTLTPRPIQLEFVQSLASPAYLHFLATSGTLYQEQFLDFLRYLR